MISTPGQSRPWIDASIPRTQQPFRPSGRHEGFVERGACLGPQRQHPLAAAFPLRALFLGQAPFVGTGCLLPATSAIVAPMAMPVTASTTCGDAQYCRVHRSDGRPGLAARGASATAILSYWQQPQSQTAAVPTRYIGPSQRHPSAIMPSAEAMRGGDMTSSALPKSIAAAGMSK